MSFRGRRTSLFARSPREGAAEHFLNLLGLGVRLGRIPLNMEI